MTNTNAWNTVAEKSTQHEQGGLYVRLADDGDTIVGAFCGDPVMREVVWTGERYETYDPTFHNNKRPSLRVMLNFYVPDEGEMKVIEGGIAWFKNIVKVRKKYGLETWLFEIERHGAAGDPKTKYSILPEAQIDPELREEIAACPLHDLKALSGIDDTIIDKETAAELSTRLRALPVEHIETFLKQCQISRVRDLLASQLESATLLLGALEIRAKQQLEEAKTSVDPFA